MRLAIVEKLMHLFHPVVVMKDHAFEQGFDDLGQTDEDLERKVPHEAGAATPAPDDEIDSHVEQDRIRANGNGVLLH